MVETTIPPNELTGEQVVISPTYKPGLPRLKYSDIRRMRQDPVISLCRLMFFAGILSGEWSYEGEDEERVAFIEEQISPIRRHLLATGALGCFDFGWQPYEKIFEVSARDTRTRLRKLKPLLQDFVEIETGSVHGEFLGFKSGSIDVPLEKCLLLNFDVEGTNWYGQGTVANARRPFDASEHLQDAAERFDKKMAGAHWVVRYPDSRSTWQGQEVHNSVIADAILKSLQAAGSVAIPISQSQIMPDMTFNERAGWTIELVTASGASFPFADRFKYLDVLKARALGFPERALLEGTYGTKAEAESHQDFLITLIEYRHDCLLELINWHLINQILVLNYGVDAENSVVIKASPINDSDRALIRSVYEKVIGNSDGFLLEAPRLDLDAISERLGIPRLEDPDEDIQLIINPADQQDPQDPQDPAPAPEPAPEPTPEPTPAPVDQQDAADQGAVQQTALNGSQIASLLDIVQRVVDGALPKPSAAAVMTASFPLLTPQQIAAILDPLVVKDTSNATDQLPSNIPPQEPAEPGNQSPREEDEQEDDVINS